MFKKFDTYPPTPNDIAFTDDMLAEIEALKPFNNVRNPQRLQDIGRDAGRMLVNHLEDSDRENIIAACDNLTVGLDSKDKITFGLGVEEALEGECSNDDGFELYEDIYG